MSDYTVKQLSDLAKVSVRTLHYYDEIGLLKPSFIAKNNYRYYDENDAQKLQQIMLFKEMGFGLEKIRRIINSNDFDLGKALVEQLNYVEGHIEKQKELLSIIKQTIKELEYQKMKTELYQWPSEERQREYNEYLIEKYGEFLCEKIEHSQKQFANLDESGKQEILNRLEKIETALVSEFKSGILANAIELTSLLDAHRDWVSYMWGRECPKPAYAMVAENYLSTPDFVTRYETLAKGFSQWLPNAMKAYAVRN